MCRGLGPAAAVCKVHRPRRARSTSRGCTLLLRPIYFSTVASSTSITGISSRTGYASEHSALTHFNFVCSGFISTFDLHFGQRSISSNSGLIAINELQFDYLITSFRLNEKDRNIEVPVPLGFAGQRSIYSAAGSVLVPHSGQNLAPCESSAWQLEHFSFSCDDPHSEQNFAPSLRSAPHFTQGTWATSILPPQSAQNFAPTAFCLPQFGQATVAGEAPA